VWLHPLGCEILANREKYVRGLPLKAWLCPYELRGVLVKKIALEAHRIGVRGILVEKLHIDFLTNIVDVIPQFIFRFLII